MSIAMGNVDKNNNYFNKIRQISMNSRFLLEKKTKEQINFEMQSVTPSIVLFRLSCYIRDTSNQEYSDKKTH